jgi:hypothetical protein
VDAGVILPTGLSEIPNLRGIGDSGCSISRSATPDQPPMLSAVAVIAAIMRRLGLMVVMMSPSVFCILGALLSVMGGRGVFRKIYFTAK